MTDRARTVEIDNELYVVSVKGPSIMLSPATAGRNLFATLNPKRKPPRVQEAPEGYCWVLWEYAMLLANANIVEPTMNSARTESSMHDLMVLCRIK